MKKKNKGKKIKENKNKSDCKLNVYSGNALNQLTKKVTKRNRVAMVVLSESCTEKKNIFEQLTILMLLCCPSNILTSRRQTLKESTAMFSTHTDIASWGLLGNS